MNLLTPEYKEWGKTVKKTLIDKDMTMLELAQALHVSKWTVYDSISGKQPNEQAAKRISDYLGINTP